MSNSRETNTDKALADALHEIASALYQLGNADAATPMGGLEAHGLAIKESAEQISNALTDVADAIRASKG